MAELPESKKEYAPAKPVDSGLSLREARLGYIANAYESLRGHKLDPKKSQELLSPIEKEVEANMKNGYEPEKAIREVIKSRQYFFDDKTVFLEESLKSNTVYCVTETALFQLLAEKYCPDSHKYAVARLTGHVLVSKNEKNIEYIDYGKTQSKERYYIGYFEKPVLRSKKSVIASELDNAGEILEKQGKLNDAIACYERSLKLDPNHAGGPMDEVSYGKFKKKGLELVSKLINQPKNPNLWNEKGDILRENRHMALAVACYNLGLSLNLKSENMWKAKGVCLDYLGLNNEATACYNHLPKLAPTMIDASCDLAKMGKPKEAILRFNNARQIDPILAANEQSRFEKSLPWSYRIKSKLESLFSTNQKEPEIIPSSPKPLK